MLNQKAISALRDDANNLFNQLLKKLAAKAAILENIYNRESDKLFLLRADAISDLKETIEDDNDYFEKMDVIDYEITKIKEKLSRITGIEASSLEDYLRRNEQIDYSTYRELTSKLGNILTLFSIFRDKLIEEMEKKSISIKRDLESLQSTASIDQKYKF